MAFKPRKNCNVCIKIRQESPNDPTKSTIYGLVEQNLLRRHSLTDIARAYPDIRYETIRQHSKKHQGITETKLVKASIRESEVRARRESKYGARHHSENRGDLVEWLMEQIDEGKVKPTAGAIVQLLKQQTDIEEKQKDREHEYVKLFASYVANPLPPQAVSHVQYVEAEVVESDTTPSSQ